MGGGASSSVLHAGAPTPAPGPSDNAQKRHANMLALEFLPPGRLAPLALADKVPAPMQPAARSQEPAAIVASGAAAEQHERPGSNTGCAEDGNKAGCGSGAAAQGDDSKAGSAHDGPRVNTEDYEKAAFDALNRKHAKRQEERAMKRPAASIDDAAIKSPAAGKAAAGTAGDSDGWEVIVHERKSGLPPYKVWRSPAGKSFRTLREAVEHGFTH